MSIVRLYNCPYFINGECSLREDAHLLNYQNTDYLAEPILFHHCPKGRAYCHVDVDTDKWSKGTLEIIRILVKGWRRRGNGNAGEIIDIIEQILRRQDDMKDDSLDALCVSRKWFDEKQAEARQKGREEAWDLTQRINLLPDIKKGAYGIDDLGEAFGTCDWSKVMLMPVEEALKKDKAYQKDKKALHIGDEVKFFVSNPIYKVVTGYVIGFENGLYGELSVRILAKHGSYLRFREMCEKTGKHNPDIEKVMASFEEDKE